MIISIFSPVLESTRNKILIGTGVLLLGVLVAGPFIQGIPIISQSFLFYLMFWTGLALSINIVFGFTGYIPFGYFAFYGIGSYGFAMSYLHLNLPLPLAVIVGGIAGALLGAIFLPMFRLDGIYFAIANFAGAFAVRIGITLTPDDLTGGGTGLELAQAYAPFQSYYAMLIVTVAVVLTTVWLLRSRLGIMLQAIREDPVAAETSGINRSRIRSYAWIVSTVFAGLFGAIDAWNTAIVDPTGSFDVLISVKPLLYAIFGGPGTLLGPILGASSLYFADTLVWRALPLGSYFLTGLVLMLVVLLLPRGLINEFEYRKLSINGIIDTTSKYWRRVVN
jgi:branched-chain amino acid transport system permease protein